MNRRAYLAVVITTGFGIGLAEEGTPGYTPVESTHFSTWDEAHKEARRRNQGLGLTDDAAWEIVAASMRSSRR